MLKPLQKLNRHAACSILQQGRTIRITSRTCSTNFGLSGFSDGANIAVVPSIFPFWTANSSPIRPKVWVFLWKCPNFGSNSRSAPIPAPGRQHRYENMIQEEV